MSFKPPNRDFVMASEEVFSVFHQGRREVGHRWPYDGPESYGVIRMLREAAFKELRDDARQRVQVLGFHGPYLIPV